MPDIREAALKEVRTIWAQFAQGYFGDVECQEQIVDAILAAHPPEPAANSHWYVSDAQWDRLRKLLATPHEHGEGMNECAICDTSLVDDAADEIERLRKQSAAEGTGHPLEQARRNWKHWQQRAEIAEERLAAAPAPD
jgi:hypothetical protein